MDLYTRQPYWLMKNGLVSTYTSLGENIDTDVAIIGAGISGALSAYYLRNSGLSIAVIDRRHAGMGSTAASTAFLQYEIDTPLTELSRYTGEENAVKCYRLCLKAIYDIEQVCNNLKPQFDFHIRPSLQYASFKKHKDNLLAEYKLRLKHGFNVEWLGPADIKNWFGFEAPGAIFSADGGEVDAYLLTHALLKACHDEGHQVFNNTNIKDITHHSKGVTLHTGSGLTIKARKLIIAGGYESLKYIPKKIADIYSTYALVSEALPANDLWHKDSLVWETATPYLYFRTVNGNRILVGGKDDKFHHPHISNERIKRKAEMLRHSFCQKMKHIPLKPDFSWGGAFAITKDGLPYIGSIPEIPHTFFALGYGGNGITFSAIAAGIIRDTITGKKNENAHLFSFNR
jgi:glycine/D-amino acid oxidase-like deaminating enzyme